MEKSFWQPSANKYPTLSCNLKTDILVVGGGICGILCAYKLASNGYSVVLVEKDEIASHRTIKTTAVITALQDIYYSNLVKTIGYKKTQLFLKANLEAIDEYKKLSKLYSFDFEEVSSYKYSYNSKELNDEIAILTKLGYHAEFKNLEFNKLEVKAIEFPNQGQMNPIKLIEALAKSFTIYEHSMVKQIKDHTAFVNNFKIEANKIIITTGYPFFRWHGGFYMKLTQTKSYVVALKTNDKSTNNGIGGNKKDLYFRSYGNYLLVGGNDTSSGKMEKTFNKIEEYISKYYSNELITNKWINQDCISLDGMPYIGKYRFLKDVYVATGFNLWGMTGSMIAATVLFDTITGKENEYEKLFSIYRPMLLKPLIKNIGNAFLNLIKLNTPRCKHLGCALIWNEDENCFECPCHGSKYSITGKPIENPANSDL